MALQLTQFGVLLQPTHTCMYIYLNVCVCCRVSVGARKHLQTFLIQLYAHVHTHMLLIPAYVCICMLYELEFNLLLTNLCTFE